MSFYIRTSFANGGIRFGVTPRAAAEEPADQGSPFSTGPEGEYRPQGKSGFFFADEKVAGGSVESKSGRGRFFQLGLTRSQYVMLGFGALLLLLGVIVLLRGKTAPGVVEIIIGTGLIATPFIPQRETPPGAESAGRA